MYEPCNFSGSFFWGGSGGVVGVQKVLAPLLPGSSPGSQGIYGSIQGRRLHGGIQAPLSHHLSVCSC